MSHSARRPLLSGRLWSSKRAAQQYAQQDGISYRSSINFTGFDIGHFSATLLALAASTRRQQETFMADFLLYEQVGHIVTLTMNEPERRNPLTGNTAVQEFLAAIQRIENDRSVRAVILTGAGSVFSSGGNIKDMERQASGTVSGLQIRQE